MRSKKSDLHITKQAEMLKALWESTEVASKKDTSVDFLKSILTESEQLMLARRLYIARMLLNGLTQNEIRLQLRLSPNTVWKVKKWLTEQMPDYGEVLRKTEAISKVRADKKRRPTPWYRSESVLPLVELRRKYPLHFLLFNLTEAALLKRRNKKLV